MICVYITIDTEYSSGLAGDLSHQARADNFSRSILCETKDGPAGITRQLDLLAQHGQRAVFFVDPMPALVWGVAAIEDVLAPILEAGQDVQLHCHTEWIALAGRANPLPSGRTGNNLYDFPADEQERILDFARATLIAAGAPSPVAFRAGNYGVNDDTLRVLAALGLSYDTSHCPALAGQASRLSLGPETRDPVHHCGLIEVPVGSIGTLGGGQRHAQVTALSRAEMRAAILHARQQRRASFTLVGHSFELINRRTRTINSIVMHRFESLCRMLAETEGVTTGNYRDTPPQPSPLTESHSDPLPPSPWRTGRRLAEQFVSNFKYGAL